MKQEQLIEYGIHVLNQLNNLRIKSLISIQQKTSDTFLSHTVYVTKIVSKNDFDLIRTAELISIGIVILATKSLLNARNIARQATNSGLLSILFQIEVIYTAAFLDINDNRVVFHLGPVFHVKSLN